MDYKEAVACAVQLCRGPWLHSGARYCQRHTCASSLANGGAQSNWNLTLQVKSGAQGPRCPRTLGSSPHDPRFLGKISRKSWILGPLASTCQTWAKHYSKALLIGCHDILRVLWPTLAGAGGGCTVSTSEHSSNAQHPVGHHEALTWAMNSVGIGAWEHGRRNASAAENGNNRSFNN